MTLDARHQDARAAPASGAANRMGRSRRWRRSAVLKHVVINLFLLIVLAPFAWVLMMSVKSLPDAMRGAFWPHHFDFTHYSYVFHRIPTLPVNMFNSIFVTAGTVLATTACAVLAGYALVHLRMRNVRYLVAAVVVSLYVPTRVVSLVSVYEMQSAVGLINSTSGLILPYVAINLAISILIMRSTFQHVPHDLIESATIDGAGPWRALWSIALPLARNGVVVVAVVSFVAAWGEFLLCSTLINDQSARTMPVVLAAAQGGIGQWSWPNLAAVYVIVAAPAILAFALVQRAFFKGLIEGMSG